MTLKERESYLTGIGKDIYGWGTIQNDGFDKILGGAFYKCSTIDEIDRMLKEKGFNAEGIIKYYHTRFFRYQAAMCDEELFCLNENVSKNPDSKDKNWDFSINGVKFDLKSTRLPNDLLKTYEKDYLLEHPELVINFFYDKQSQGVRNNNQDRLFLATVSYVGDERDIAIRCAWEKKEAIIKKFCEEFNDIKIFNYSGDNSKYKNTKSTIIYLIEDYDKHLDYKFYYS